MDKIKILHVVRPAEGGMKQHLLNLAKYTDKTLFEVRIACPAESSIIAAFQGAGICTYPISLTGYLRPKTDWHTVKELLGVIRSFRPHIVHTHSSKAGLVGRVAARLGGVPVILFTAHNSIFYEGDSRIKQRIFAVAEKSLSYCTDRIITVSEALRDELVRREKINPRKITVIPNGIDIGKFQQPTDKMSVCRELKLDPKLPIVGTIARLAPQKGLSCLIEAAAAVQREKSGNPVQFVVIGDGPLRGKLEQMAAGLGLGESFRFAGERHDVEKILPVMDVFVLPSVTEGLPLTVLEALASATPVVASAVGGIPEVIENGVNGLLVPPKEPALLAAAITKILQDKTLAGNFAARGQQLARNKYSLEAMVKKIADLNLELLSQKSRIPYIAAIPQQ